MSIMIFTAIPKLRSASDTQSRFFKDSDTLQTQESSLPERHYQFRRGELLSSSSRTIWQIETGFVRTITWNESGTVITLGVWGCGDLIGQSLSQLQPYQIECLTEVCARKLSEVESLSPTAMLNHVHQTEKLLSIVHQKQTSTKILLLLEWLAQRFGNKNEMGWVLEFKLTHQVISEIIGTTRVTVTRIMQQLEQEGHLIRDRRSLILPIQH